MYRNNTQEIVLMALKRGMIVRRGGWFTVLGHTKIQGEAQLFSRIHENEILRNKLISFLEVDQSVIRELSQG